MNLALGILFALLAVVYAALSVNDPVLLGRVLNIICAMCWTCSATINLMLWSMPR